MRPLLGPSIRLQTSKLNLKSAGYGAPVEWHQDWAYYPYTNQDVLAMGVLLDDFTEDNGAMMVVPGQPHRARSTTTTPTAASAARWIWPRPGSTSARR